MATITVPTSDFKSQPKVCEERAPPRRSGDNYEFTDATEEHLAFRNTLSDEEKSKVARQAHKTCFFCSFKLLRASKKQEEYEERENELGGGGETGRPGPNSPPQPPLGPPVQEQNCPRVLGGGKHLH
jgi:hypothetical protein